MGDLNPHGFYRGPILEKHRGVCLYVYRYCYTSSHLYRPDCGEGHDEFVARIIDGLNDAWAVAALWHIRAYRYELLQVIDHPKNASRKCVVNRHRTISEMVRTDERRLNQGYTWDDEQGDCAGTGFAKESDRYDGVIF